MGHCRLGGCRPTNSNWRWEVSPTLEHMCSSIFQKNQKTVVSQFSSCISPSYKTVCKSVLAQGKLLETRSYWFMIKYGGIFWSFYGATCSNKSRESVFGLYAEHRLKPPLWFFGSISPNCTQLWDLEDYYQNPTYVSGVISSLQPTINQLASLSGGQLIFNL